MRFLIVLLGILPLFAFAQVKATLIVHSTTPDTSKGKVFSYDGFRFMQVASFSQQGPIDTVVLDLPSKGFYYVGTRYQNAKPLLLAPDAVVEVYKVNIDYKNAKVIDQSLNKQYDSIKEETLKLKAKKIGLLNLWRAQRAKGESLDSMEVKLANLESKEDALLVEAYSIESLLGDVVALNKHPNYPLSANKTQHEIDYFVQHRFDAVDWSSARLAYNSWVFESMRGFVQNIAIFPTSRKVKKAYILELLKEIPEENFRTKKLAYSGLLSELERKDPQLFLEMANQFVSTYAKSFPAEASLVEARVKKIQSKVKGFEAPNFTQNNLENQPVELKDFRGQYLLLDFWASWCGPCRRANPAMVALYDKYKDKGFQILGISLDKTKDRWVKAIETDGLEWPQVSDLKGWNNAVATQYGVRSIPYTVLLDPEGKIVEVNVKGEALDQLLSSLLDKEN